MNNNGDWSPAEEEQLRSMAARGGTAKQIAKATGRTKVAVRFKAKRLGVSLTPERPGIKPKDEPSEGAPPATEVTEEFQRENAGDTERLVSRSRRIKTLEDLLDHAEVDTDVWEVERYVVNKWEMGAKVDGETGQTIQVEPLYQVKAWLKRNRKADFLKAVGDEIIAGIEARKPDWRPSPTIALPRHRDRFLLEVCMMDLHVGKLAWSEETGEDYDITIAEDVFTTALEELISGVQGRCVEEWVFPIGNDLFHIDNLLGNTTAGTAQDTDTRYAKVYARAEGMMKYALERLSELGPGYAPIVPGNHDRQSAFSLGRTLRAWFHGNDRVTVDAGPRLRKYHRYGVNLIGYTHGSEEKPADLPLIMAQERPQDWSETKFREFHIGHLHKSKETRYVAGDTFNGVRVRIIPSLCATDAWHSMRGYVGGVRSAEAYLWNRETGYAGHIASNVIPQVAA